MAVAQGVLSFYELVIITDIVINGEVLAESYYVGEFDSLDDAKLAAFNKMKDGNELWIFENEQELITDSYGCQWFHGNEEIEECVTLYQSDGTIEGVPEDWWFWSDQKEISEDYKETYEKNK